MSERPRISAVTVFVEFASIVVAVLVALGVDQWKESRTNHALATAALRGVRRELSINQFNVRSRLRYHQLLIDSIGREVERLDSAIGVAGRGARVRALPKMGMVCGLSTSPLPNSTAWQVVLSTNVLAYLDYQTVSTLTETYARQQEMSQQMVSTDRSMPELISASFGERPALGPLQNLQIDILDLRAIEQSTLRSYGRAQALLDSLHIAHAPLDTVGRDSLAPCRRAALAAPNP